MKHYPKLWRGLLFSLLLVGAVTIFTSCGDDEPSGTTIDYYVEVEAEFLVDGSSDIAKRYYSPITRMREAIRKAYPTPNSKGDDEAVIAACDKEYQEYCQMYDGSVGHITCLFNLIHAVKKGSIVRENIKLKTYVYDLNSTDE